MADMSTEFTPEDIDDNLQAIDKIRHPNPSNADIYAAILALRRDIKPMMDFFAAIPEAIESNPMMSMMFGKALKRK